MSLLRKLITGTAISISSLGLSLDRATADEYHINNSVTVNNSVKVEKDGYYTIKVPATCMPKSEVNVNITNNINAAPQPVVEPAPVAVSARPVIVSSSPGYVRSCRPPMPPAFASPGYGAGVPYGSPYPYPSRNVRVTNVGPRGAYRVREVHDSRPFGPMGRPVPMMRPGPVFGY